MNVLIVHPHLMAGGAEKQVLNFANYLQKKNHKVTIVTLSLDKFSVPDFVNSLDILLPEESYKYKMVESSKDFLRIVKETLLLKKMVSAVADEYDALNPHNFPSSWACSINHKNITWTCNEPPYTWNKVHGILVKPVVSLGVRIDSLIVNRYIKKIGVVDHLNQHRVWARYRRDATILFSGVDYEFFSKGDGEKARNQFKLHGKFVILHVGWISPQKNQLASIHLLAEIYRNAPDAVLVLAGRADGYYADELRCKIRELNLSDRVIITGMISDEVLRDLYTAANVLIFPTENQTWGLAPLEGLCAGVVPIVSPKAGVASIIEEQQMGVVSDRYSESVMKIYNGHMDEKQMISRGQSFIRSRLTWDGYCERLYNLVKS